MELNNNINSSVSGIGQNDSNSIQKSELNKSSSNPSTSIDISIDPNNLSKRTNLSELIYSDVQNVSNISSLSSMLKEQVQTVSNIELKLSDLKNNSSLENTIQPNIAELILQYNTSTASISDKMAKQDDLEGDSTTYFDGKAGAIPLDVEILDREINSKKSELANALASINETGNKFKEQVNLNIAKEIEKIETASPFKEIDFGKESADFSSTNITAISGSIVPAQANATQTQALKLLS